MVIAVLAHAALDLDGEVRQRTARRPAIAATVRATMRPRGRCHRIAPVTRCCVTRECTKCQRAGEMRTQLLDSAAGPGLTVLSTSRTSGQLVARSRSHSLQRYRPRFATAIASLCLLAQLYPLIHFLVVPHTRCEVHGDMLHAREHEAAPGGAQPARGATTHAVSSGDEHGDEHEHEHCQLLTERRDARCTPTAELGCAPPSVGDAPVLGRAAASSPRPLYRLAPKLSPPRAV